MWKKNPNQKSGQELHYCSTVKTKLQYSNVNKNVDKKSISKRLLKRLIHKFVFQPFNNKKEFQKNSKSCFVNEYHKQTRRRSHASLVNRWVSSEFRLARACRVDNT